MSFFSDFLDAIESYPADSIVLSTVLNLATDNIAPATPGAINKNEIWRFKIRTTNTGQLNLTNMFLYIQALNGATVSLTPAGPFSGLITTKGRDVDAHESKEGAFFFLKAPMVQKPAGTQLVMAGITSYDANLDHLLKDHTSGAGLLPEIFASEVFP